MTTVDHECKESAVGNRLVVCPYPYCLANRILLCWMVRVSVPFRSLHRRNEERDIVTHEWRDFAVSRHASHDKRPELLENLRI